MKTTRRSFLKTGYGGSDTHSVSGMGRPNKAERSDYRWIYRDG